MKKESFTVSYIEKCKCKDGKSQTIYWDAKTRGLGLRVTANGAKSYIFEASLNNKTMRITIGDINTYTIDGSDPDRSARAIAGEYKTLVNRGIDPRQEKAKNISKGDASKELQRREALTLGVVWPIYLNDKRKKLSEWSIRDIENIVLKGGEKKIRGKGLTVDAPLVPLLNVRLVDLTPNCIASWFDKELETRPTRASTALRLLSAFMSWCETKEGYQGLAPIGACKAKQVKDKVPKPKTKVNDCLQREQLRQWFESITHISNLVQSAYLQSLLLTGARRRELSALKWSDVDFKWLSMTIRDKVEGERTIPLTPYVAHLISTLPKRNEWVFSSVTSATGHIEEPKKTHKQALESVGIPHLTIHGLRRSFATLSEWVEAPAGIAAQIQGHKPQGVRESNYIRRPLDLLRMWHVKIESWILEEAGIKFIPVQSGLCVVI